MARPVGEHAVAGDVVSPEPGRAYGTIATPRRMLPRDEGTIIQVGSALVYRAMPLQSASGRAGAAIEGSTDPPPRVPLDGETTGRGETR